MHDFDLALCELSARNTAICIEKGADLPVWVCQFNGRNYNNNPNMSMYSTLSNAAGYPVKHSDAWNSNIQIWIGITITYDLHVLVYNYASMQIADNGALEPLHKNTHAFNVYMHGLLYS